jgi:hypothetical protein
MQFPFSEGEERGEGERGVQSEPRLRLGDVANNLSSQFVEGSERFLVAEPGCKSDFHFFAIKIAGEIEQMGFNAEFWYRLADGRTTADVQNSMVWSALNN